MLELFGEAGALTFSVVETRRAPSESPTSLIVMLALVGLGFELGMLTGARPVHPIRMTSIGAPTETLIIACGRKSAGEPMPWSLEGFATSEWGETCQRTPIHFKPQDLTWERARFSLTMTVGTLRESGTMELAAEQQCCRFDFDSRRFAVLLERARRG